MTAYDDAMAKFVYDSTHPPRPSLPLPPGLPIAQSKPAPINTTSVGIFQPVEHGNIDGIITEDDSRLS